jgi:hypothetical protein
MNISRGVNPTEHDYQMFERHVNILKSVKDETDAIIMQSRSTIPNYLYLKYEHLTKFHMFIWNQSSSFGDALPYNQISIPERLRILQYEASKYAKYIASTVYVFDHKIFQTFVSNINYFFRVGLIKEEEVAILKTDLKTFLNDLENMAIKGVYEETGRKVSLYITDIDRDINYSCLKSKNIQLTLFWVFILNVIMSFDEMVCNEASAWIRSLQRMSTLISVSGERIRAAFFEKQHKIIDTL